MTGLRGTPGEGAAQGGQASVELLGAVPVLLLLGLVVFQVFAVGYTAVLAGNAAEAGALALAAGGDGPAAARRALPGWSERHSRVTSASGRVEVVLLPPSPLGAVSRRIPIRAAAAVEVR